MRSFQSAVAIGRGLSLAFVVLLSGCGTSNGSKLDAPSTETDIPSGQEQSPDTDAQLDVVQVMTLTTVQASDGLFLSPSPEQNVPSYIERGEPGSTEPALDGLDRAEVSLALLFQSPSGPALPAFRAELRASGAGEWSPIERYFPAVEPADGGASWPIELVRNTAFASSAVSSEWSGWQAFGGLGVRQPRTAAGADSPSAAVATLDFEVRGAPSPLVLTGDVDDLVVTNHSGQVIERALLIYSHLGGVGVTAVNRLGPGASSVTGLGPKEQPPGVLLERARATLRDFFAASIGDALADALADAKSIPFLQTRGLRLISLLEPSAAPATLAFSVPTTRRKQVVVSHSEILKADEEQHVLSVVADLELDAAQVASELGRFSEAKLEYAATRGDEALRARAEALLVELRNQ